MIYIIIGLCIAGALLGYESFLHGKMIKQLLETQLIHNQILKVVLNSKLKKVATEDDSVSKS